MSQIVPIILSGGSGTRLWPLSTPERPKQFLALTAAESMFQLTVNRFSGREGFAAPIVVANIGHADLIDEQLAELGQEAAALVLEPLARNTAPAIALAALEAGGDDTLLLVMPSDHAIRDPDAFRTAVSRATKTACEGWLVTFGITPTRPETGYGYVEMAETALTDSGIHKVLRFVEKPDGEAAQKMLEAGNFAWNAGIFLFRADRYLDALSRYAPEMERAAREAHERAARSGRRVMPDAQAFAAAPSDSIDYAVMEKAENVAVKPLSCGWSDIGCWDALRDVAPADASGNVLQGDVIALESRGLTTHSEGVRISLLGVQDLIVVATAEEVLIMPRGRSQDVRKVVAAVREAGER